MSATLVRQLFELQIIQGEAYISKFESRTTKKRVIKSTRGNIYDRNGEELATNVLAYSVTFEDNGTYDSTREKNLTLNGIAYKVLKILESNGDSISTGFHIVLDEGGNYAFDVDEGFTLNRFRADIYGEPLIDNLTKKQKNATADQMIEFMSGKEGFSIVLYGDNAYTKEELTSHGLPENLSKQDILELSKIRYALSTNSFKKYMAVTIASNISEKSVAAIREDQPELQGIDIVEDSVRKYIDDASMGPILGYTGQASSEELEELRQKNPDYSNDAIIGKSGIEKYMETSLQGTDGEETVTVDNPGKVLKIDDSTRVEPVAGNDTYLTIDSSWQSAIYQILKQRVAGILLSKIEAAKTYDFSVNDAAQIKIPIYDVYNALIANSVIDISKFSDANASDTEKKLYAKFQQKQQQVFDTITNRLTAENPPAVKDEDDQIQEYLTYICDDLLRDTLGIISKNAIDTSDSTYQKWTTDKDISLKDYLTYAASQNWIDISKFSTEGDYLDSDEVYRALTDYLIDYLKTDTNFSKLLYKYMLQEDTISGSEICLVLYEQGVLSKDDGSYEALASGSMTAYDFMINKIYTLEIEPAQLALEPCSASAVITDVKTGDVLACVSYPGYDNNRLANNMDTDYYRKLNKDLSTPFYNKATQERTAPGSTFKPVTAIAGLSEGVITDNDYIYCGGRFDKLPGAPLNCWLLSGHGALSIRDGIANSCNVFFSETAYRLGQNEEGTFNDNTAMQKLIQYANLMGLDKKSGLEISEASPQVSNELPIPSAIGQGTHSYTTSQLARYATVLASSGNVYNLSLLDKSTDSDGNLLEDYTPEMIDHVDLSQSIWDDVHAGMEGVITKSNWGIFQDLNVTLAGKTGTAQQSKNRANHSLFIGYAPADNPQIAWAIRIANGYASTNSELVAKDILNYYFGLKDETEILTGQASSASNSNAGTD